MSCRVVSCRWLERDSAVNATSMILWQFCKKREADSCFAAKSWPLFCCGWFILLISGDSATIVQAPHGPSFFILGSCLDRWYKLCTPKLPSRVVYDWKRLYVEIHAESWWFQDTQGKLEYDLFSPLLVFTKNVKRRACEMRNFSCFCFCCWRPKSFRWLCIYVFLKNGVGIRHWFHLARFWPFENGDACVLSYLGRRLFLTTVVC